LNVDVQILNPVQMDALHCAYVLPVGLFFWFNCSASAIVDNGVVFFTISLTELK